MNLQEYEHAKFELAELLQSASLLVQIEEDKALYGRFHDLFVRLAEDRFNLVVAGRFNRGKSSLMNAILGMDRLPAGIVPLTSVITTVSYGTKEKARITHQKSRLDSEITLRELPEYITQRGNPGNRRGIATANIQLPAEILRRGFYFVDTPGLGSIIPENTLTTQSYLPETDALLLVTSFESPLSEEELRFFEAASRSSLQIFVAINKHDLVTETERDEAITFVRDHLRKLFGESPPDVFSVSARDGLNAKCKNNAALLGQSGIPALESRLTAFLLSQKQTEFLGRMSSRVCQLFHDLPPTDGIATLRERAGAARDKFNRSERETPTQRDHENTTGLFNQNQLRSCQVCAEIDAATWDFLARYQYELATNLNTQTDFAFRSGFCCFHTWDYQGVASPYGTCSGYPPLLERIADALHRLADASPNDSRTNIERLLPTTEHCVVCSLRDEVEAQALIGLADNLRSELPSALKALSALCLPHLAALAKTVDRPDIVRALADQHALTFERIAEDMRRFTLKHSAVRRDLESEEEETAARRALLLVSGSRNANFMNGKGGRPKEENAAAVASRRISAEAGNRDKQ
jgi:GTP-binding protein EngB required for normal cell division